MSFLDIITEIQMAKAEAFVWLIKWTFILSVIFLTLIGGYVVITGQIPSFNFKGWYCQ